MIRRVEAQHAGRRMHAETRVLILRALGVAIGFMASVPLVIAIHSLLGL